MAVLGCAATGDDDTAAGTGGAPPLAMGAGGASGAAGSGAGGAGGAAAAVTMCGGTMCPMLSAFVAMSAETCCSPAVKCSLHMKGLATCPEPYVNTTMCPNDMSPIGMLSGCCFKDNECGIWDSIMTSKCISKTVGAVSALMLKPANCDGTPVMTGTGGMGTGGMGTGGKMGTGGMGSGGMGSGGMGTGGKMGTGGTGTGGKGTGGM